MTQFNAEGFTPDQQLEAARITTKQNEINLGSEKIKAIRSISTHFTWGVVSLFSVIGVAVVVGQTYLEVERMRSK
tara:strand:- start:315 stop:539 length:225 start_codon:yes stop_codon:yes gene_type:complete